MAPTKKDLYREIMRNIYANGFESAVVNPLKHAGVLSKAYTEALARASASYCSPNVLSKQYYEAVTRPCYSDNSRVGEYSAISIDFNDMAKINAHGRERGDEILHDSIQYMQEATGDDAYCIRMGGDEFLFFLDGIGHEKALEYEELLHAKLQEHSQELDDTTVTSYCVSSEQVKSLDDMVEVADAGINHAKQTAKARKTGDASEMEIFRYKIKENFSTFFKNLRLHNFPLRAEHLINFNEAISLMYRHRKDIAKSEASEPFIEVETHEEGIELDKLKRINEFFVSHINTPPTPSEIETQDFASLQNLLQSLVRDPLTKQFNKNYLLNYLLADTGVKYKALLLSSSFVKISNTLNSSHKITDFYIKKAIDELVEFLRQRVEINSEAFNKKVPNHVIVLGGGDIVILLEESVKLSAEEIRGYLEGRNSRVYSKDTLIRLAAATNFEPVTSENFHQVLAKQTEECNNSKKPMLDSFLLTKLVANLFEITLQDNLSFFEKIIPNPDSFEAEKLYLRTAAETLMELYKELDIEHTEDVNPDTIRALGEEQIAKEEALMKKEKAVTLAMSGKEIGIGASDIIRNIITPSPWRPKSRPTRRTRKTGSKDIEDYEIS